MKKTIKKPIPIILILAAFILHAPQISLAEENPAIDVIIKGRYLNMEERPILKNDRAFVPLMYFVEGLDFNVEWIQEERTAKLNSMENTILIPIGEEKVIVNGVSINLGEKIFIENDRTYLPLRSLAELLNQKVEWDEKNKTAIVGEFTDEKDIDAPLDDKYLYTNEEYGFNIKIPNTLKDKIVIKEDENGIVFFDKYNYDIEENLGVLFTITKTKDPEILNIVPSTVLKYDKGTYYIAHFASDVQFIVEDEKSTVNYMEMSKIAKEFLPSFDLIETKNNYNKNYNRISKYMKAESIAAFSPYYELLDFQISNYKEEIVDGNVDTTFSYRIVDKNYDKDPDTVDYIKKAKESGDENYHRLYNEYLEPKESNFEFKAVIDKDDTITLYSNISPKGVEWKKTKMTDYIIRD